MVRRVGESNISRSLSHTCGPASFPNSGSDTNDFVGSVWRRDYVVVDLETTGLGTDSQITEIGAVRVKNGEVVDTFNTLVNPQMEIPPKITALTGITNLMVTDAPHPDEAIRQFLAFAQLESSILIAHNASFDCGFLTRAAAGAGIEWPRPKVVDTLALARTVLPRPLISNHRLGTLVRHFKISNDGAHRALSDATATAHVFSGLVNELGKLGATDFEDLMVAAQSVPYRHRQKVSIAKDLPAKPGLYRFVSADGLVLYIGSATNLRSRVRSYFSASEKRRRIHSMLERVESVRIEVCASELEARVLELRAIAEEQPPFNAASRHQFETAWLIMEDGMLKTAHTISSDLAPQALGPYRRVTHTLKAREAILLALGGEFAPFSDIPLREVAAPDVKLARMCLEGRGQIVSQNLLERMADFSDQSHFELAARIRDYFSYYIQGVERARDTALIARATKIIWAHHLPGGGWQIHAASRGRLLTSVATPPLTSPAPWVNKLEQLEPLPETSVHLAYSSWEEVRVITRSLLEPGARLIEWNSPDPWAWPVDSDLKEFPRFENIPRPRPDRL